MAQIMKDTIAIIPNDVSIKPVDRGTLSELCGRYPTEVMQKTKAVTAVMVYMFRSPAPKDEIWKRMMVKESSRQVFAPV